MAFRESRHSYAKRIIPYLFEQVYELVAVLYTSLDLFKLFSHFCGRVTAEGKYIFYSCVFHELDMSAEFLDGLVHKGKMMHAGDPETVLDLLYYIEGGPGSGPACPVCYGNIVRLELCELFNGAKQVFYALGCFRWKDLEGKYRLSGIHLFCQNIRYFSYHVIILTSSLRNEKCFYTEMIGII